MLPDEAELVRRAKEGDDQAFASLVRPHVDRAYRLALSIIADPAEAEDALQDALYKAWRALPQFRHEAAFSTWLWQIVRRTSLDRIRRAPALAFDETLHDHDPAGDPAWRWEQAERRHEVFAALNRLPIAYRTVLTLFYVEELPIREIAEVLELPVGTVKTQLHRARKALRRALSDKKRRVEGLEGVVDG